LEDRTLALALLNRDEDASTQFHEKIRPVLVRAAVHFLGYQDPDVEDVVQDTLAVAFRKMGQYEPSRSSLANWVTHICVKLCFQRLRKRQRHLLSQAEELEVALADKSRLRHAQLQAHAESEARLTLLREELRSLEGLCASILELRHVQGQSYAGIAKVLKVPIGTVMSRLARCRDQLKQRISRRTHA
jgi:RNA polymerase sigma-70 factor (ECF subfamily)